MPIQKWRFTVPPEDGTLRLDQLVAKHTGLSRRQAREALSLGGVQVDRARVKVAGKLIKPGREVTVAFDEALPEVPDVDVPVVFEDDWLLAVNKPAGLPTQGTWATDRHDLLALLRRQRPDLKLYLHHRLDQPTSGLLLFSKAAEANKGLTAQFEGRDLEKLYLARISEALEPCTDTEVGLCPASVWGSEGGRRASLGERAVPPFITVEEPIGRLRNANPGRFACEGDLMDPRPARTDFRLATAEETASLAPGHWIVARLHTGRTHQIRVHLAHLGRPILGDTLYGGAGDAQLWLHAWRLGLMHPVTGERLDLEAPALRFRVEQ